MHAAAFGAGGYADPPRRMDYMVLVMGTDAGTMAFGAGGYTDPPRRADYIVLVVGIGVDTACRITPTAHPPARHRRGERLGRCGGRAAPRR
jgi:hypothetical protein